MDKLLSWLRQPSSVAGVAAAFGSISALLMHQIDWAQAVPLLAGAMVSVALPDNSAAKTSAESLARDFVSAVPFIQEKK